MRSRSRRRWPRYSCVPKNTARGPLQKFFDGFNRVFGRATEGYAGVCRFLIHKTGIALFLLAGAVLLAGVLGKRIPTSFLPDEDQGYVFAGLQLPDAASLQRTDAVVKQAEEILKHTPGVETYLSVIGYSMLSGVNNTYSAFFFIPLKKWSERTKPEEQYGAHQDASEPRVRAHPGRGGVLLSTAGHSRRGHSGGVTFVLEDRSGKGSNSSRPTSRSSSKRRKSVPNWPASSARRCCPCRRFTWM